MTLSEIDNLLPNGFHDAEVNGFGWNFLEDTAFFDANFWVATLEGADREKRRRGRIELQQICFISFEPPCPRDSDRRPYRPSQGSLQIDGALTNEKYLQNFAQRKAELSPNTEMFSFYVNNWNSFIHIAAGEAKLIWTEE